MTQLRITINTDNAAFEDYPRTEISRILRQLAAAIEVHGPPDYARPIFDSNGNRCGMMVHDDDDDVVREVEP